tara:strand:+ start:165 stop:383 length:219 start_codon:yes stop_codon:yes gene_type:complete
MKKIIDKIKDSITDYYEIAKEWITDRCAERTSLDGVILIAFGIIAIVFQSVIVWVGLGAIAYGIYTLVKSEW